MENRESAAYQLESGSKKSSSSPKVRLVGQLSLLFVAIGLVSLIVCAFTIEDFEFFDTLRFFLFVCIIPAFAYLYAVIDSVKQNMTEDQRKAHLLAMAKQQDAEAKQYKIMMSGGMAILGAFSGFNLLINANTDSAFINGLLITIVCGLVAVAFISSAIKNLREFRQILEEEAAGKLDYLKRQNDQEHDFIHDEALEYSDSQNRESIPSSRENDTSRSHNANIESQSYESVQF